MAEGQKYAGWANYETWAVFLWLGNDPGSDRAAREAVRASTADYEAAQALKSLVEEANPLRDEATLFSNLLSAAISAVDWYEIAEAFQDEDE